MGGSGSGSKGRVKRFLFDCEALLEAVGYEGCGWMTRLEFC